MKIYQRKGGNLRETNTGSEKPANYPWEQETLDSVRGERRRSAARR